MSGTPSPGPAPDALELAALLCSRVCHDLISPVGAIVNGLEVLDDNPKPEDREFALDLIRKSAKTASARLQFCRLAFGAAGSSGAQIDLGDAAEHGAGPYRGRQDHDHLEFAAAAAAEEPGQAAAEHAGDRAADDSARRRADGRSGRRRRDDRLPRHRRGPQRAHAAEHRRPAELRAIDATVDAHAVQPYYTRLLAQACGLKVMLAPEGDAMVVTAPGARTFRQNMVNQRLPIAARSLRRSYLFVDPVLFQLLNHY